MRRNVYSSTLRVPENMSTGISSSGKIEMNDKERLFELASLAGKLALDKKGEDVIILKIGEVSPSIAEYFVIVTGHTKEHLQAISDYIDEHLSEELKLHHVEGYETGRWVLLDYLDIVIHIMTKEAREYYSLEFIWADAPIIKPGEEDEQDKDET